MSEQGVRVSEATLRALIADIFGGLGFTGHECAVLADTLLEASLAGYDSHGVIRIPMYWDDVAAGRTKPGITPKIIFETPATARIDAGYCMGPVSASLAVEKACEKAAALGIGAVGVMRGSDVARLGGYVARAAGKGFLTQIMVNDAGAGAAVAPLGGRDPVMSTNPFAVGIPRTKGAPIVVDLSTSIVALGKLRMACNTGERVPEGWLVGRDGRPETDPNAFFHNPRHAALNLLGAPGQGHKGFGLSLMVDSFAGALTGAGTSTGRQVEDGGNGFFVMAVNPEVFGAGPEYAEQIERLAAAIKASAPAEGVEEITLPGERAARETARRKQSGLPIDAPTWARIRTFLAALGIEKDYPVLGA